MAESEAWQMRQAAKRIVRKTKLTLKSVTSDEKAYNTYYASVASDAFKPWFNDIDALKVITQKYSEELHKRIDNKIASDANSNWWTMSTNHIYSETIAHVFVHILSAGLVRPAQIVDLNIDESRVLVIMLMEMWGYNSALDNEKN